MTTYTIEELREKCSFLEYCLISAIAKKRIAVMEEILNNTKTGKDGLRKFDIKLVVNGVDVPLKATFKDIENQFDSQVTKEAKELLDERLLDFGNELDETVEDFKDGMAKILLKRYENS